MRTLDKRIELLKKYQAEMDHRTEVENEAVRLMEEGQFEKAEELLKTLDDNIITELQKELDTLSEPEMESKEQATAETIIEIEEPDEEKTNKRLQKYQEGLGWLKSLEEKPEEQTLTVTEDYSSSDKSLDNFKCLNNFEDETVLHYCTKQEMAEIAGRYGSLDWLIGDEKDIKNLTADMAGFKSEKSQRVIIDYDKGYGRFLVRRFDMDYGAQGKQKDLEHRKTYKFEAGNDTKVEVKIEAKIEDLDKADLEEILHEFATCTHNFYLSLGKRITGNV